MVGGRGKVRQLVLGKVGTKCTARYPSTFQTQQHLLIKQLSCLDIFMASEIEQLFSPRAQPASRPSRHHHEMMLVYSQNDISWWLPLVFGLSPTASLSTFYVARTVTISSPPPVSTFAKASRHRLYLSRSRSIPPRTGQNQRRPCQCPGSPRRGPGSGHRGFGDQPCGKCCMWRCATNAYLLPSLLGRRRGIRVNLPSIISNNIT